MVSKAFRLASFLRSKVNALEKVLSADLLPLHKNIEIEYEGAKLVTKSSSNSGAVHVQTNSSGHKKLQTSGVFSGEAVGGKRAESTA